MDRVLSASVAPSDGDTACADHSSEASTDDEGAASNGDTALRAAHLYPRDFTDPLRFTPQNMLMYEQGRYSLIKRDLALVLAPAAAARVEAAVQAPLARAFDARREIISLKKICLRLFNEGRFLELALMRLGAFFFVDDDASGVSYEGGKRGRYRDHAWVSSQADYQEVSKALHDCRGTLLALQDARDVTKWACCLPRHPELPRPPRLRALATSGSLAAKLLWRSRRVDEAVRPPPVDEDEDDARGDAVRLAGLDEIDVLLKAVDGVTEEERAFARASVVCRVPWPRRFSRDLGWETYGEIVILGRSSAAAAPRPWPSRRRSPSTPRRSRPRRRTSRPRPRASRRSAATASARRRR
jgi:hypothetical protein